MRIHADFGKITGKIKPMHGVGQAPIVGNSDQFFHYLSDAGIPYSRLHDVGGEYGLNRFVDIPNIFRDFDADVNDPESYDFAFTDWLLEQLAKQNCEPIYRLGVSIENGHLIKSYRIFPPADYEKWAQICEHIILHYNYGWANGYHYKIQYWEIWNEPDDCYTNEDASMWKGTPEEYFRLYEVTANHLKRCFGDEIKVGGYASCGFFACDQDPDATGLGRPAENLMEFYLEFLHNFFQYITSEEHRAPLDFFSWHLYGLPQEIVKYGRYCRRVMAHYGFDAVEDILNEWNLWHTDIQRGTPYAAGNTLATMLGMQKERTALLTYYDARIGVSKYSGMFNPDSWKPYLTYWVFQAFNRLYQLQNEVESASDCENVFVGGAANETEAVLLLANAQNVPVEVELAVSGANLCEAVVKRIDGDFVYEEDAAAMAGNRIWLPAYGCAEIAMKRN